MAEGFSKVAPDAPNRCQANMSHGQCNNAAIPGCTNCGAHGGTTQAKAQERESIRNYRLAQVWVQQKLDEKSDASGIKSLRNEIGLLRILMEERLNRCTDASDLLLHSQHLSELAMKLERLVTSCHKLEGAMKQVIDRQALLNFASSVIGVIGDHVENEETLSEIGNSILKLVSQGVD